MDEYSGLMLLRAETGSLSPLPLASAVPAVGSEMLAAAAWGLEQPLVARGIVGGVDRQHPSSNFPPLLQCDVLTSETSTGAGVVNSNGQLLGVIVAADREGGRRGWAYAVPAPHIHRLIRVADDRNDAGIVILKRRRPVVGLVLDQNNDAVLVQRLTPGGPAEKAGIDLAIKSWRPTEWRFAASIRRCCRRFTSSPATRLRFAFVATAPSATSPLFWAAVSS